MPNVLRILIGEEASKISRNIPFYSGDTVMLSANIDDSTPEVMGHVMDILHRQKPVRDAWLENIYMKKNRPAFKLCVICGLEEEETVARIIFKETSTIGIRREELSRYCLDRKIETIKLPYGEVKVKNASISGKIINSAPEYESCRKLAEKTGKAIKVIYHDVEACFFISK